MRGGKTRGKQTQTFLLALNILSISFREWAYFSPQSAQTQNQLSQKFHLNFPATKRSRLRTCDTFDRCGSPTSLSSG